MYRYLVILSIIISTAALAQNPKGEISFNVFDDNQLIVFNEAWNVNELKDSTGVYTLKVLWVAEYSWIYRKTDTIYEPTLLSKAAYERFNVMDNGQGGDCKILIERKNKDGESDKMEIEFYVPCDRRVGLDIKFKPGKHKVKVNCDEVPSSRPYNPKKYNGFDITPRKWRIKQN